MKVFDEVNVATALHRLAKLQPPGTSGPQSPVLRSAAFQLLVEACQRLVPRFEAQAVSNTLWGERAWHRLDPECLCASQCTPCPHNAAVSAASAVECDLR